jgi:hypothetical protein
VFREVKAASALPVLPHFLPFGGEKEFAGEEDFILL